MSALNAARRNALPTSAFALPGERAFPVNDKTHARAAKSRASGSYNAGRISASTKARIDAKANHVLKT